MSTKVWKVYPVLSKMVFKSSCGNVLFMEMIIKTASVLGLAPFYNFQHRDLRRTKLFKCYSLFLVLTAIILNFLLQYQTVQRYAAERAVNILFIAKDEVGLILFIVAILNYTFFNVRKWQGLFSKMHNLECEMNKNIGLAKRSSSLKAMDVLLVIGAIYLIVLIGFSYGSFGLCYGYIDFHLFRYLMHLFCFLMSTLIINIVFSIKCKYERMNVFLCNLLESNFVISNSSAAKSFRKVMKSFSATYDIIEDFKKLLGFSLSIFLLYTVLNITSGLTSLINLFRMGSYGTSQLTLYLEPCYWVVSMNDLFNYQYRTHKSHVNLRK